MSFIDVHLFDSVDGGNITELVETRDGLETAIYLSLFGGNAADDGRAGNLLTWWGNIGENEANKQYKSEAAYLLRTVPPNTANLKRIEAAAVRDLAWLVPEYSKNVDVSATMPALNSVNLSVSIDGLNPIQFRTNWGDDLKAPIYPLLPPKVTINDGLSLSGTAEANSTLILIKNDGVKVQAIVSAGGNWGFEVYPLTQGERGRMYASDATGKISALVTVIGVLYVEPSEP